ncbi:MAG: AraC family transcriptional regulator [Saprospiraceae bacterium]
MQDATWAQGDIRFRHFGKKDGLSQNSVFAIAQDGRGVMWLQTGKLNVSEVAYRVGFNEPKYFSKVFQKEFGCSPSQFQG